MKLKDKIFNKYILYVICFVILNIFDAVRDMQLVSLQIQNRYIRLEDVLPGYKMGDIWMIVSNATGIFMMLIVLSGYKLKQFLTKVNAVWTGCCILAMIILPFVRTGKYGTILVQEEIAIINVWWIVLVAKQICVKAFREKKMPIKFNALAWLWIAITMCMFFSVAKSHMWPIFYLGMFGCFYLTEYKKQDIIRLFNAMIDGSIIAFVLMQTIACLLRPYDTARYEMLYSDCNMAASYYLIIYVMCLAKLHLLYIYQTKIWKRMLYTLMAGVALSLQFMTGCRTVWGAAVVVTVFYGIIVVKKLWNKNWISVFICGILLTAVTIMMLFSTYLAIRWMPTVLPARLWYADELERLNREVLIGESKYSEKYVEFDELIQQHLARIIRTFVPEWGDLSIIMPYTNDRLVGESKTAIITRGLTNVVATQEKTSKAIDLSLKDRAAIYKAYYNELTWWGNNITDENMVKMRYHAHSLYLQIAFSYGIPAGMLLIIIAVGLSIYSYKRVIKDRNNPYVIIPFMVCIIFFGTGIMNVVWNTGQLMLFLVYFTQYPFRKIDACICLAEEKKSEE